MKKIFNLIAISILAAFFLLAEQEDDLNQSLEPGMSFDEIYTRCNPPSEGEDITYFQEYNYKKFHHLTNNHWFTDREGMEKHFNELYNSNKRLHERAYYSIKHQSIVIPLGTREGIPQFVFVPERFIKSTIFHIEEALRRGYAEFIFFTDMGHNHFFIHSNAYNKILEESKNNNAILYTKMLQEPSLKMLYHTAEKLNLNTKTGATEPFEYRRFRYITRNIIGENHQKGLIEVLYNYDEHGSYNTVREYKNKYYTSFSAGIYLQGSSQGCFPFRHNGKTYFFDINLHGFPYKENGSVKY